MERLSARSLTQTCFSCLTPINSFNIRSLAGSESTFRLSAISFNDCPYTRVFAGSAGAKNIGWAIGVGKRKAAVRQLKKNPPSLKREKGD